jgi:uncharacterized protein YigE (DUF2233 family)
MPTPPVSARKELFVRPARVESARLEEVSREVGKAVSDGALTAGERRAVSRAVERARAQGARLVAPQARPALAVLDRVARALEQGMLVARAPALTQSLGEAQAALQEEAARAAARDPLPRKGWTRAFAGVATREFRVKGLRANVVAVDLADPRVSLQTNPESERGRGVSSLASAHGAEVAINADFFSWGSYRPSGLAMTAGKAWTGTSADFEGHLAFTGRHAEVRKPYARAPDWARNAVSSRPTVLQAGKVVLSDPEKNGRSARTGLGLSKDGRVLYLVAVEGRSGKSGLTATELGGLLKSLGAQDALALDSGGSAQLFVKGKGMVQRSTDPGGSRAVANVLMVQSRG